MSLKELSKFISLALFLTLSLPLNRRIQLNKEGGGHRTLCSNKMSLIVVTRWQSQLYYSFLSRNKFLKIIEKKYKRKNKFKVRPHTKKWSSPETMKNSLKAASRWDWCAEGNYHPKGTEKVLLKNVYLPRRGRKKGEEETQAEIRLTPILSPRTADLYRGTCLQGKAMLWEPGREKQDRRTGSW